MSARRELQEHQAATSKPSSVELGKRNREAGLNQAIMFYPTRPDPLPEVAAWLERDTKKLCIAENGVVFSVVLEEEV